MTIVKNGCQSCRRKTIMTLTCKCNMVVCFSCRHPEDHKCTFDYQKEGKEKLTKDNPVVVASKIEKV